VNRMSRETGGLTLLLYMGFVDLGPGQWNKIKMFRKADAVILPQQQIT
jgi:hypothetical protein